MKLRLEIGGTGEMGGRLPWHTKCPIASGPAYVSSQDNFQVYLWLCLHLNFMAPP